MKKFFSFVIAACALFLFYSCEKQEQINDSSNFNGTLVFSSAKPEMADESGTRTVWTGSSVKWKAGDKIRVGFTLDGVWQSGIEGDTTPRFFASNDLEENKDIAEFSIPTVTSGNTSFQADYIQSLEGDLVFYGLYPSSCTSSATQTNAPEISITVPADQKPTAESFDPSADILIGKTQTLDATPTDPVLMDWSRIVALADITLKELNVEDGESLLRLTLTAQEGADLVGNHSLNLEELTVSSPAGTTNEITLNVSSLAISSDNTLEVWVGLLPATITSLTVVLETNAATYTRTISGFSKTFVKNKRNLLGIKMTGATRVAKENVNPYALKETSNVSLEKGSSASDATVNGFEAVKVGTSSKSGTMSVTVPAGSTKLHIHAAGWTGTNNCVLTISGADLTPSSIQLINDSGISNNTPFTLAGSVDDYYYAIELTGITSDKEITFTATSTGKRFVIWGVNVEPEPAEVNTPTLTFNNPTTTVNVGDKVTNIATIDPDDLTVTYSSSAESVATVNASTGEVTGIAAGTTTITASFAGNDQYEAVTASYTLTVTGATGTYDFTSIAELNDLVTDSGDNTKINDAVEYDGKLTGAVVSFVPNANNAIIKDATGSILVFKNNHGLLQGQTFSGDLTVSAKLYYTTVEITAINALFTGSQTEVLPATMTLSQLEGNFSTYQNAYVKAEGLTVTARDAKNITVSDGTKTYMVYDNANTSTAGVGDVITAVGTVADHNGTNQIKVWASSDITVTSSAPKAITFSQPSTGGSFTVSVGGSNITSGTTVDSGTTVTLTATPAANYTFNGWTVNGATVADPTAATTTFTMGSSSVSISASFTSNTSGTTTYTKVTSAPSDWSGTYILVYESSATSGLVCLAGTDAYQNYTTATISSGVISSNDLTDYEVDITSYLTGYSIKALGGANANKYLEGKGSSSNGTTFATSASKVTTFSLSNGAVTITNNTNLFVYNSTAGTNGERWRFYKSGTAGADAYKKPALYKKN